MPSESYAHRLVISVSFFCFSLIDSNQFSVMQRLLYRFDLHLSTLHVNKFRSLKSDALCQSTGPIDFTVRSCPCHGPARACLHKRLLLSNHYGRSEVSVESVSRCGLVVERSTVKQADSGSIPLRLNFLFRICG